MKLIAGGVNSPVRAMKSVGETPLFIASAQEAMLTDVDGNRFTDYCLSWGVFILGHAHPAVNRAIVEAVAHGTSYGLPSLQETALAKHIHEYFPSMERLRFVNSGTEAVMSVIRLARAYTRRNIVVKFDGCYHGHVDHLLVSAGSGVATLAGSSSAGVPNEFTAFTVSLPYNDPDAVEILFKTKGEEIAAVIVEPVPANMGVILPSGDFLHRLRSLTEQYRSLLIFDEIITGFRTSMGGVQHACNLTPDLTTLGKIIGGGFPAAAFGGRADILSLLAPEGNVYQAGTLSGNPVAMSAGIATLCTLAENNHHEALKQKAELFFEELSAVIAHRNIVLNHYGTMFTLFFTGGDAVNNFADAGKADTNRFARFFRHMLEHHIYLSPSQFEANFLSIAHTDEALEKFLRTVKSFND
jgi:glutamate-1-semialdehyde 2,1-aminomutase